MINRDFKRIKLYKSRNTKVIQNKLLDNVFLCDCLKLKNLN